MHADGLTQNALIVLCDGVYIELIEFLDKPLKIQGNTNETLQEWKERKSKHWWYGRKSGWVDWCLRGGVKDKRASCINKASKLGIERDKELQEPKNPDLVMYKEAMTGGRRTPSGKDVKWNVTFPQGPQAVRGRYPFWCEDVTPREWRGENKMEVGNLWGESRTVLTNINLIYILLQKSLHPLLIPISRKDWLL